LKAIGIVKYDKKDAYQDSVTAPLSREHDDDAGGDVDGLEDDTVDAEAPFGEVLTAIPKVIFVFWTSYIGFEIICIY
jgi:hypothetical protein